MSHLKACFTFFLFAAPALAAEPPLKEARERWLRGNYDEARANYETLLKDPKHGDAAALGLSRVWQSQGEYDKALAVVDAALEKNAQSAELHARRAELLHLRGRWDEAEKAAEQALRIKKDNLLARWVKGQVFRDRGKLDKAGAEFRWFVAAYNERSENDKDIEDADDLLLVGLAGSEDARWQNLADQLQFITREIYPDALKNDKSFWPALYQKGALYLEKHNPADAAAAFDKALAINPRAAEACAGKGQAALQKYDIQEAERWAERALKINPSLIAALTLRADVHLAGGEIAQALRELERARAVNPRDETVLGRLAACLSLQGKKDELQKLAREVEKHDPKPGLFYYVLAERLEDRRHYLDAEKYYQLSIAQRPMLPGARSCLGLLAFRLGREPEARDLLAKAFEADPFNLRVDNALRVLEHLDKYETVKTEHFEIRFDPQRDRRLAGAMAKTLEEIHAGLVEKFQYRPQGPILIELFNSHLMFSGRVIALPDLHTIGACTGRVVALVSPRGKGVRKPFNWVRVLRHELVHVFNLEQTHFLVPHWLTEGLAVSNEGYPRPQSWNELLGERLAAGTLMDLDTIDLGFIRPRSPEDWNLAYCQSQLYVEYIQATHGPAAIGRLLAAYAEGLDTAAAIARICKVDKAAFEKGYRTYLDGVARTFQSKPPEKAMTLRELKEAHEKAPDNAGLSARLAEACLKRDQAQARRLAEAVLAKTEKGTPAHGRAACVKAQLMRAGGEDPLQFLEEAVDLQKADAKVLQLLGKLYFDAGKFPQAAAVFERARQAEPHESKWLAELARVYAQKGDKDKYVQVLQELAAADADDLDLRKQLAGLLRFAGKHAEAEKYARQALEIDVLDAEAQQILGDALLAQKKPGEAVEAYQAVVEIREQEKAAAKAELARLKLAQAYLDNGQREQARSEVAKVLARNPNNAEAKQLQGMLEK